MSSVAPNQRLFVRQSTAKMGRHVIGISAGKEAKLLATPIPYNLRELKKLLERAFVLYGSQRIAAHILVALEDDEQVAATEAKSPTLRKSVDFEDN